MSTWAESTMESSMAANRVPWPLDLNLANPWAIRVEDATVPRMVTTEMKMKFWENVTKEIFPKPFHPME